MIRIGILSGPQNGSPKILARTLQASILETGNEAVIDYNIKALRRLFPASIVGRNPFLWSLFKLRYYVADRKLFRMMAGMDAVVICDWTPHGFYTDSYNVTDFKTKIGGKPVFYYAVQYLMNSPTIIEKLAEGNHASISRYDWHLTVSAITEKRGNPAPPWHQIGLNLESTGIKPTVKDEFMVIVDFLRPGYESYRETQIQVLEELGISYISLEGSYELEEIRRIYSKAAVTFIQFPEAYGMPIAECLGYGSYIGTPDSSWPMAWRLDREVEVHGSGTLADCFLVYNDAADLKKKLAAMKESYDVKKTPLEVFGHYTKNYPDFYYGNKESLMDVLNKVEKGEIKFDY